MKVKSYICRQGKDSKANEDWVVYRNSSFVMILDGATGLLPSKLPDECNYHTWAEWFVKRLGELVADLIHQPMTLKNILKNCIYILKHEYERMVTYDPGMSEEERKLMEPSASVAILRETKDCVELFTLGDLSILLKYADGRIQSIYDNSVEQLDEKVIRLLPAIAKEKDISVKEAFKRDEGTRCIRKAYIL